MNKKENGQSLIEALVALGAATLIVSAIAIAVIASVNNSDSTKYQNLATTYAQQGLEIMSGQSKSDWTTFHGLGGSASPSSPITYCFDQGKLSISSGDIPNGSCPANINIDANNPSNKFFIRQVSITKDDPSCAGPSSPTAILGDHVLISVLWTDGKCANNTTFCHKVEVNSCYANIITLPTP